MFYWYETKLFFMQNRIWNYFLFEFLLLESLEVLITVRSGSGQSLLAEERMITIEYWKLTSKHEMKAANLKEKNSRNITEPATAYVSGWVSWLLSWRRCSDPPQKSQVSSCCHCHLHLHLLLLHHHLHGRHAFVAEEGSWEGSCKCTLQILTENMFKDFSSSSQNWREVSQISLSLLNLTFVI